MCRLPRRRRSRPARVAPTATIDAVSGVVAVRPSPDSGPRVGRALPGGPGSGCRRTESEMVVEIHDHLVSGRRTRSFAIGDIVECGCRLPKFGGQRRYAFGGVLGQFIGGATGSRIQCPALLKTASHRAKPMTDRGGPIFLGGKLF